MLLQVVHKQVIQFLKFFGGMVGGLDVPIGIILGENLHDIMIFKKGYLLCVKSTEEDRGRVSIKSPSLAYGKDKLND